MRPIRYILFAPSLLLFASGPLASQELGTATATEERAARNDGFGRSSLGFQIHQLQRDFGVGLHLTSPYFHDAFALRAGVSAQWLDHIPAGEAVSTWDPYLQVRGGIVSRNFLIPGALSIYSEGGFLYLRPNASFSSARSRWGGYGLLGVEFHGRFFTQFLEVGGVGTDARADRSEGAPIHSNGFLVSAGMRWYR